MNLDDAINSYETAVGGLPPCRESLPTRLSKSWRAAKTQYTISFNQYHTSPPASSFFGQSLVRMASALGEAVEQFKIALQEPQGSLPDSCPPERLLALLLTRDEIRRQIKEETTASIALVTRLAKADQQLKEWARKRRAGADRATFSKWRDTMQPDPKQWWWSLDDEAKPHALWTLFAGLFFAGSLAIGADTFAILKNVTTTNVTAIGTIAQSLLALLAGSAFTASGQEWLGNAFSAIGIDRKFRGASRMWLAFAVFALFLAGWFLLPIIASDYYIKKGAEYKTSGLLSRSNESYEQAIALKPKNIEAHFGLADSLAKSREFDKALEEYKRIGEIDPSQTQIVNDAYFKVAVTLDKSREYDKAIELYKRVIELDPNEFSAVNNLARLYILDRKDARGALPLLNKLADNIADLPDEARYYAFKNMGWATLELQSYAEAEGWLRTALNAIEGPGREELRKRCGAAAHYLLGRVFESQNRPEQAFQEWEAFGELLQQNPDQESEVEPEWPGDAQMKTLQQAKKQPAEKGDKEKQK